MSRVHLVSTQFSMLEANDYAPPKHEYCFFGY
jgi:hypothetical protein